MTFAQILTIVCSFGAGILGAVVFNWGLYRGYRELQSRVYDLEERIISEIKKRAGAVGREQQQKDRDLTKWAEENAQTPASTQTPVLKPLMEWRREKMASGGK